MTRRRVVHTAATLAMALLLLVGCAKPPVANEQTPPEPGAQTSQGSIPECAIARAKVNNAFNNWFTKQHDNGGTVVDAFHAESQAGNYDWDYTKLWQTVRPEVNGLAERWVADSYDPNNVLAKLLENDGRCPDGGAYSVAGPMTGNDGVGFYISCDVHKDEYATP